MTSGYPTDAEAAPLDCWRNRLAVRLANAILRSLATREYCDIVEGAIALGLATAAARAKDPT